MLNEQYNNRKYVVILHVCVLNCFHPSFQTHGTFELRVKEDVRYVRNKRSQDSSSQGLMSVLAFKACYVSGDCIISKWKEQDYKQNLISVTSNIRVSNDSKV